MMLIIEELMMISFIFPSEIQHLQLFFTPKDIDEVSSAIQSNHQICQALLNSHH